MSIPILLPFVLSIIATVASCTTLADLDHQSLTCTQTCTIYFCAQPLNKLSPRANGAKNILRADGDPMAAAFCKNRRLLTDVSIGEAMIKTRNRHPTVPISQFMVGLVKPQFNQTFFKVTEHMQRGQTLMHAKSQGNQYQAMDDVCVVVPINNYQMIENNPTISRNSTNAVLHDCISFRAVSPKLIFQVTWDSRDDLDLRLSEPTSPPSIISRFSPLSETGGKLLYDVGSHGILICAARKYPGAKKRESIVYARDSAPPRGTYAVEITHLRNCGRGSTKFEVKVVIDGKVVSNLNGTTNGDLGTVAGRYDVDVDI